MTMIGALKWTCRLWCVAVYVNLDVVLIPQYGIMHLYLTYIYHLV